MGHGTLLSEVYLINFICSERERDREREGGREGEWESGREGERERGRGREGGREREDSFALFYEDELSMTMIYRGHHCTHLRLGVVSPVGRDGRPPTFIKVGQRTGREILFIL